MEFTVEQIQSLKKEIEGIWTHLNNIEKQLGEKKEPTMDSSSAGSASSETIEMLKRMYQKVETQEQEAEQMASDDSGRKIDKALMHVKVKKALDGLKQQLGIS